MSTALAIQSLKMRKAKQTNKEEASVGVGAGAYEMQDCFKLQAKAGSTVRGKIVIYQY